MIRVAFVVQRYGTEVVGGAETLARNLAERLSCHPLKITVFTTTARDYISWKNEYIPGDSILKGVTIRRFKVDRERNITDFNSFSDQFFQSEANDRDEMDWIIKQGPYSPGLIEALGEEQHNHDIFIFFTYLYHPTIVGMQVVDKPIILFPTAHDELPLYLNLMAGVFQKPRAIFFLTTAEMELVSRIFSPSGKMSLVRTGVNFGKQIQVKPFKQKYRIHAPYILYAGRIEKGKGLEAVFEAFGHVVNQRLIDLVLIGKKLMPIPNIKRLRYLGFVPEEDKQAAFKGALFSVQPSPLESLSITTLESFAQKTPVLVNEASPVLVEHVSLSGGGYIFKDTDTFCRHFYTLYDNDLIRKSMGEKGHAYVTENYSWDVVINKIKTVLHQLTTL